MYFLGSKHKSAPGGGADGWGISVVIRVSLYEFRSVQR